jgi:RimJ/RimL family protein N-acetyltransferase
MDLQPTLENELVKIIPLKQDDFEKLYLVASDPLIWEQHPNKTRYQREVFAKFFEGAMESGGAFLVYDKNTDELIGSSRYYEFDEKAKSISIGYTFFARSHWGGGFNPTLKKMMMAHAFQFVDKIHFHIGAGNKRSQIAIERLGALKIEEREIKYYGEPLHLSFIYEMKK